SLQKTSNTNYFSYGFSFNGNVQLPLGFSIYAAANYWLNTGLAAGYNQHITLLNGYIAKSMAHNRALLKLHVSDLLNRNTSIERT
ncbi:outer membrane beta-barrel protein, partial [Microbacterium sp. GbtcB4]